MKNLLFAAFNIFAVALGCNFGAAPDFKPQGFREVAPKVFAKDYEKVSISTHGGFYDQPDKSFEKGFCIGTTLEKPETVLLESARVEAGGKSYAAEWSNNTTLDGTRAYGRKECGHLTLRWNFDRPQGEIFASGAEIVFNLKLGGAPETVRMPIVPAENHRAE